MRSGEYRSDWQGARHDGASGLAGRLDHVDAAKGISIFLVVFWHAVDDRLVINEALWMLRMPLFFFVCGLFAGRALDLPWARFLPNKVGNTLYLYILWTFLMYATTNFVAQYMDGRPISWERPFMLFTDPPRTLWFMYALAVCYLIAKPLRKAPALPVMVALLGLYSWSISSGDWRIVPFHEKIIRLFPFFFLALWMRQPLLDFVDRHARWGYLALPAFVGLALVLFETPAARVGPLTFCVSLLGVAGILMVGRARREHPLVGAAAYLGKRSLFVYVMHRIPLFYATNIMERAGIEKTALSMSVVAVLVTIFCLFVGELVMRWGPRFLFDAPWLKGRDALVARLAR